MHDGPIHVRVLQVVDAAVDRCEAGGRVAKDERAVVGQQPLEEWIRVVEEDDVGVEEQRVVPREHEPLHVAVALQPESPHWGIDVTLETVPVFGQKG